MRLSVTWLGHSCFLIQDKDVTAIIDPFMSGNPTCPIGPQDLPHIDAVLVTHDHDDHVGDAIAIANGHKAICLSVVGTARSLISRGLDSSLVMGGIGFNIGGTVECKGMRVTMVQAFHTSNSGLPVGYVITMPNGTTLYHAGDTGVFGDMALIGSLYHPNVAMLPCGGFYVMDAVQAAEACRLLNAPAVIPMHWGTFGVLAQDTTAFKAELAKRSPATMCIDMIPGQARSL